MPEDKKTPIKDFFTSRKAVYVLIFLIVLITVMIALIKKKK